MMRLQFSEPLKRSIRTPRKVLNESEATGKKAEDARNATH
jgi:hypothetical protein